MGRDFSNTHDFGDTMILPLCHFMDFHRGSCTMIIQQPSIYFFHTEQIWKPLKPLRHTFLSKKIKKILRNTTWFTTTAWTSATSSAKPWALADSHVAVPWVGCLEVNEAMTYVTSSELVTKHFFSIVSLNIEGNFYSKKWFLDAFGFSTATHRFGSWFLEVLRLFFEAIWPSIFRW